MSETRFNGKRERAVVIGGGFAGLLAARVLADHFDHVIIVERDRLADQPSPRKGVPQARHLHVLLARGRLILEKLFPGLIAELVARGAPLADMAADLAWLTPGGWGYRCDSGISIIGCSRDLLDWSVRQRLLSFPSVTFFDECEVTGLSTDPEGTWVDGVKVRERTQDNREALLRCNLVVEATGRGSRLPEWLAQLGFEPPRETIVNAFLGYTSRVYRRHPALKNCQGVYVQPAPPDDTRGGALFPIEGDRWILTLAGYGRDYPPADEAGFLEFARSLRTSLIYAAIKDAEPVSPIFSYRATENRLRHFERMPARPEGFVALGDAACAFNPVYAQGITMSALAASILDECLRKYVSRRPGGDFKGFGQRFQERLAKTNKAPWMLATSEDFRVRGCEGKRPGGLSRVIQRYFDTVVQLSTETPEARRAVLEVFNMLKPPISLLHPGILLQVALHSLTLRWPVSRKTRLPEELNEATR